MLNQQKEKEVDHVKINLMNNINLILHKFIKDQSLNFEETIPEYIGNSFEYSLVINPSDNKLYWKPYNLLNIPNAPKEIGNYNLNIDKFGNIDWIKISPLNSSNFITKKEFDNYTFNFIENIKSQKLEIIVKDSEQISVSISSDDDNPNINYFKFNINTILNKNKFIGTNNLYYINDELYIKLDSNKTKNGLYIGDGEHGISFGNGTNKGFVPEILGHGSDDDDPGLYFISKIKDEKENNIPAIVIDAVDEYLNPIHNRPIFGITSGGIKSDYKFIIDSGGKIGINKIPEKYKLEVNGTISSNDLIINNNSISKLIDIVKEQQKQINELKNIILKIIDNEK